jgi:hypothetical protein
VAPAAHGHDDGRLTGAEARLRRRRRNPVDPDRPQFGGAAFDHAVDPAEHAGIDAAARARPLSGKAEDCIRHAGCGKIGCDLRAAYIQGALVPRDWNGRCPPADAIHGLSRPATALDPKRTAAVDAEQSLVARAPR